MRPALIAPFAALLLTACAGAPAPAPVTPTPAPAPRPAPATYVLALEPGVATPAVPGPFVVLTINPGSDLDLGISKTGTCEDAVWFNYSGGGAAVGPGETLCAHSHAGQPVTHGFSGTD